jgi:hypothetical protein
MPSVTLWKSRTSLTRLHQKSGGGSRISSMLEEQSHASHNLDNLAQLESTVQNGGDVLDFHKVTEGMCYSGVRLFFQH